MAQQIDLLKNTSFEGKMDSLIAAILKGENYDYNPLTNKPSINGYTLEGNKTNAQLGIPTKTSDISNDSGFVEDKNYVHTDENFTSAEKTKLGGISDGAEANVQANWSETDPMEDSFIKNKPTIPSKTSDLTNDSNYVVDSDYKHTDNNYTTADKNSVATIGDKVDKVTGKGLSTNDLTDALKANYDDAHTKAHEHSNKAVLDATTASFTLDDQTKLTNIESGAQKNTITGVKGSAEEDYRVGNVNITKTNIGLENVANERQWSATNHPTTMSGYGITDGVSSTDYNTLKGRVDTNEDNIAMLDSDVEGLTTDVGTLKTDMTTVKGAVTTIQDDYVSKTRKVNGKALSADITLGASDVKAIPTSQKGVANGVAELDANGIIKTSQLPSSIDEIIEADSKSDFPTTGESSKIYIALDTNLTYRWAGTQYVEISPSLALGETSSTAYRGDRGKIAYDHSQKTSGNPHNVTKSDVGLSNVPNVSTNNQTPTFTKADSRDLPISGETLSTLFGKILKWFSDLKSVAFSGDYNDLTNQPTNATTNTNGLMSKDDKTKLDGIDSGANKTTVDSELNSTSTNPVQNKIINDALNDKLSATGTAAKATADASGNTITTSYASTIEISGNTLTLKSKSGTTLKSITLPSSQPTWS